MTTTTPEARSDRRRRGAARAGWASDDQWPARRPAPATEGSSAPEEAEERHQRTPSTPGPSRRPVALSPEDLSRFFVARANAGDVDGLVALYEPDAVLALPTGEVAVGRSQIRAAYEQILRGRPRFAAGEQQAALVSGDLALTSTHLPAGATAEVARRQSDGTWLWMVDQPNVKG